MAIYFDIGGSKTLVPGVYSTFEVASSILSPAAAGRSMGLIGEATEGAPGQDLNITTNYFTSFDDLKAVYKSGPLVDAARQCFNTQPSATGSIFRVYAYKPNASTRASKTIASPSGYGSTVAIVYGDRGNEIRSQIVDNQAEVKPTVTFTYLPSPAARNLKTSVSGAISATLALSADALGAAVASALAGVSGLTVTGGTARTSVVSGPMILDITTSGDNLILTRASGSATFDSSITVGDVAYIDTGVDLSGTADANTGAYMVVSCTTTALVLKQVKHHNGTAEVNAVALATDTAASVAAADLKINAPLVVSVSASTITGSAATLELLEATADKLGLGLLYQNGSFANILVNSTSSIANISATVPSAGKLTVTLSTGAFTQKPKAGDVVSVGRASLLAGGTLKNVGLFVVESASSQAITMSHLFSGMTTEAVVSVALNGANDVLALAAGFVSSSLASKRLDSSAERKVNLDTIRTTDGVVQPASAIGGNVCFELSYYNGAATAATVSIDSQRVMTIDLTGSALTDITVNTKKYKTLQDLADFLNTQTGVSAKVANPLLKSLPSSCLDMVTNVGILSGSAVAAYNGRLKKDYYDWNQYFDLNTVLVDFTEGGLSLKAGLPAAEATASYLAGGEVGATTDASIQLGFDQLNKVAVRVVIPLFSRDAIADIQDGLTDTGSTYTIGSVHAQAKAHVATASNDINRKYRFGAVSIDASFEDSKDLAATDSSERLQIFFQRSTATNGDGELVKMLPWEAAAAVSACRCQSVLGTSMLRKSFLLSSVEHVGAKSLYDDTLRQDFDPADRGQLEEAIAAGLAVLQALPGFGVTMVSPDLSSRSRTNDPRAWVYERVSVLFVCDEVRDTVQNVLESFIGNKTTDISEALLRSAVTDTLDTFTPTNGNGAIMVYKVLDVKLIGNIAKVKYSIKPAEALEAIILENTADRSLVS